MNIWSRRSCALAIGLGLCSSVQIALAQQADQTSTTSSTTVAEAPIEKIEVTGSYIRRTDTETPSPVQVITAEDLKRSGFTTLVDVLNNITANNQGTLSQGFSGAFASGACGVALRGLTVAATLVLVDGHRMAPYPLSDDGQRTFTDICSIPFDAVERVDILKDAASAQYGSDAMAGVVNVILRKSFKGFSVSAENGWSQHGGGQTSHVTGSAGFGDLSEDGQNGFVTVEYRHQDPILMSQRPWLFNQDWRGQGGQNLVAGGNNLTYNPLPNSATGYFVSPTAPATANPLYSYGYLPGCNAAMQSAGQCVISNPYWFQVEPGTENINVLARYTRMLWADWKGTLTASLFQSSDDIYANFFPPFSTGATSGFGIGVAPLPGGGATANIYSTPGPYTAPVLSSYHLNSTYFPVGSQVPINVMLLDAGAQGNQVTTQTYRLVGDLAGTAAGWDIDATYGWTDAVTSSVVTGAPNLGNLYNSLSGAAGSALQYIPGIQNSPAVLNYVAPPIYSQYDDLLYFAGAHGSRELFSLPGGKFSIATGVDFYFRSLYAVPSGQTSTGEQPSSASDAFAEGSQSNYAVFGEFDAPVLKMLDLDGSLRYDHYKTEGTSVTASTAVTPAIKFKFTPIEAVAVRGTYSKGFRAPNPVEVGSSATLGGAATLANPVPSLCPNPATPNSPGNFPSQCNVFGTFLVTGTPGLEPEHSRTYTLGLILEPVKWANLSVDYYDIFVGNQIISGEADPAITPTLVQGPQQVLPYVSSTGAIVDKLTPTGVFAYLDVPYVNLNSTETKGLEWELKNTFGLGEYGKLKSDIMWTHLLDYILTAAGSNYELAGTHGPSEISGDTATPKDRVQWILSWDQGPYEVSLTANYISGYSITDPSYPPATTCLSALNNALTAPGPAFPVGTTPPSQYCNVGSFTYFDLFGGWAIDKNWTVHGSIQNLFDRKPPTDLETYGSTNFNPSLALVGAVGRFFNLGIAYKF